MSRFLSGFNKKTAVCAMLAVLSLHPAGLGAFPFGRTQEKPGLNELKQGDAAASFGDNIRAEEYYGRAMKLGKDDLPLWCECVSRLGTIYLLRNDISSAKKLLEDFRKRIPAGSAGTLPGEILAAENDFSGAEKHFKSLIERNDIAADKAKFCLGDILLKQQRYQEAYDMFASLRNSRTALISRRSEYALVLTLIYMNKLEQAKEMLNKLRDAASSDFNFQKLRLLCAVKEGDLEYFRKNWQIKDEDIRQDDFLCSLAELAAELAAKKSELSYSAKLYEQAFAFASAKDKKQEIIGKLFSCCAAFDIDAAAKVAERYAQLFPDASDRALLLMQSGRLLASGGKFQGAVKFYSKVADDKENLLLERHAAALEGASAAEQGKLHTDADRLYNLLIFLAPTSNRRKEAQLAYAEYLLRRKEYSGADKILLSIIGEDVLTPLGEQAANCYLQSRSLQNLLSRKELPLAVKLSKSKNRKYAEFASFSEAEIFRITNEPVSTVRQKYLDFISRYADSKFVPQASFQAARLAGRDGDYVSAAGEFVAFAEKFPEHRNSGAARFIALDYFCRAGMEEAAVKVLSDLGKSQKNIDAFTSGVLRLGEHFLLKGNAAKALDTVQKVISQEQWKKLENRADILFLEARILSRLKQYDRAVAELDKLLKTSPDAPEAAEANFLAGNIRCDVFNDFAAAEKNFQQAFEHSSAEVFRHVSCGRLADCRYTMYLQTNNTKLLESADELYRDIAENAAHPDMRLQASYKAGLCREASGDREKALEDYEQTLYAALALKNSGITPAQNWCERAAYSAIELALTDDEAEDTAKAQQLLAIYRKLGFENSGRDFQILRRKIIERQKFLNRGARP